MVSGARVSGWAPKSIGFPFHLERLVSGAEPAPLSGHVLPKARYAVHAQRIYPGSHQPIIGQ